MSGPRRSRAIRLTLLAAAVILLAPRAQPGGLPRITAILSTDAAPYRQHLERFQERLPAEVTTLVLPEDPAGFVPAWESDPPNLILALGSKAAAWAAGKKLPAPLLFSMVYDPAADNLPSGPNQCGLALQVSPDARLDALETLRPAAKPGLVIGALHDPAAGRRELDELSRAVLGRGHRLIVKEAAGPGRLDSALAELLAEVDVVWLLFEPSLIPDEDVLRDHVLRPAVDAKVAVVGLSDPHVQKGALLSVAVDFAREGEHAARLAKQVLAGDPPEKIGVEPPEFVIWSLNLNVAREIGWEVPPLARKRFEKVYQ